MYRIVLKLCAKMICFQKISTDGVMVMTTPPTTGEITVEHLNTTETGGAEKVCVLILVKFLNLDISTSLFIMRLNLQKLQTVNIVKK